MTDDHGVAEALERAVAADPGCVPLRLHLAELRLAAGDTARALELAARVETVTAELIRATANLNLERLHALAEQHPSSRLGSAVEPNHPD